MSLNNAFQNYRTANVHTTDQGKLILICYDVAINACQQAKAFMLNKKSADKAKKIYKAQDAITELMVSLNMEKGGVIAKKLFALYDYFNWRLSEANVKQQSGMIDEILQHLKSLREAWVVAIDTVRKEKPAFAAPGEKPSLRLVG